MDRGLRATFEAGPAMYCRAMDAAVVVRAVHVLGAILWFGGAVAMNLVVIPGVFAQPLASRRSV
jgi:hypothetical protein